ncbi:Lrp/AsnC family transcriptional regulator [Priestia megaterium]|uniref:Lrp/AsnC family transcriptional regulator n=1 Tax=Priestia megaterium TaxID=1404 RepID=UPI002452C759|nr:Lrp/AsnC family transcriptional regulator [Priestia megaterium]MDH3144504.1 Lrp/AsnC family transcriptional regulator [Priestia megaterium]MED4240885.1 Lrp/AsnC family transcriptional regulator [Priestia megaterium]MED4268109.1 Lrp/AsnC family transcriptional regulator [Priestia megaterium]MED4280250.1 Lrp/AsnC family transcriptional regulator [Priestia megaterium]MED4319020.1 Lrp/AsnC family transcriptional regulator [Priestia megaterium]
MLDHTDMSILHELSKNSRIKMKELGEKVHLTGQAAASRVAKLEDNGVIEAYTIKVNQSELGCFMHAFINIYLNDIHHRPFLSFVKTQNQFILNNYKISGDGCYLLECRFPSNEYLNEFLENLNEFANYKISTVINKL